MFQPTAIRMIGSSTSNVLRYIFLLQSFPFRQRHCFYTWCSQQDQHRIGCDINEVRIDDKQIECAQQHPEIAVCDGIAAGTERRHQRCCDSYAGNDVVGFVLSCLPDDAGNPPDKAVITSKKFGLVRARSCSVGSLIGDSRK